MATPSRGLVQALEQLEGSLSEKIAERRDSLEDVAELMGARLTAFPRDA
ncbi:MAG: hypothetical protein OEZ09_05205 [Betaproteobacteria bacterium]|nr:hypothetical protein [Betaproteobacteria bacterium]MDH5577837.1 hypothetical protein [Betaproteobacteria bacterium]